jgi:hypothetical protein
MATIKNATDATLTPATDATLTPATDATLTPATEATLTPATDATLTPATEADDLEAAKKLISDKKLAELKAKQDAEIADYQTKIAAAKKSVITYEAFIADPANAEDVDANTPIKLERRKKLVTDLEAELKELKLSYLSPEEKQARIDYDAAMAKIESLRAQYPAMFGNAPKHASPSKPKDGTSTPKVTNGKGYEGDFNSKEWVVTAMTSAISAATGGKTVKEHYATGGTLSESEICKAMYGYGDDVSMTAVSPSGKTLKHWIHPQWVKLVLEQK